MNILKADLTKNTKPEKLRIDKTFIPCSVHDGDELYYNGIFVFNITKMHEYIRSNVDEINLVKIEVDDFPECFSRIDEAHIDSVDVSQPLIIAEISLGNYNLIDGNHRKEKARRMGIASILAYKLNVKQHINFLTDKDAYKSYIEYWNGKLR